jgi:hypothetical protein
LTRGHYSKWKIYQLNQNLGDLTPLPLVHRRPRSAEDVTDTADFVGVFSDVRLWHKAEMLNTLMNVRYWGQSGHP